MHLKKELEQLIADSVISEEVAENIRAYYDKKESRVSAMLLLSVLGSLLLGVGIILLLAHNWDMLSKTLKTIIAFLPLLAGQVLCGYSLLKKTESSAWKESSAVFLLLGFAACIALISQIYHIKGSLEDFLFLWALIALPVIYLMSSSASGLLYIAGITMYVFQTSTEPPFFYLVFLAGIIPHYYVLYTHNPQNRLLPVFNLFVLASFTSTIGLWFNHDVGMLFFILVFALYILISHTVFIKKQQLKGAFFSIFGTIGMLILLFISAFADFGYGIDYSHLPVFLVGFSLLLVFLFLLYRKTSFTDIPFMSVVFVPLFCIVLINSIAIQWGISQWAIKALIFIVAMELIVKGLQRNIFFSLNSGLVLLLLLTIFLFFDSRISFVVRGSLFIAVGLGFFIANSVLVKKRGNNEKN